VAPHRCVIDAIVRADADLAGRVRRSLRALRDLAVPPAAEEALGTLLSSDGLALATGRRWGESLASTDSPEDLADRVFQFLHRTFCTTAMTLEWDLGGERRSIHRGRGPDGAVHERDLVAPGGNVGRLRVDAPFRLAGFEPPILAAALPWIAVAVERLCGPSDWDRRVEAWAAAHALPPRQREALRMLVRGASNKEIAVALGCSVKGAEAHVSRLLRRAAVSSRAEFLAALAR
jgi:DNA-binding CsgD family transcriptional regulator